MNGLKRVAAIGLLTGTILAMVLIFTQSANARKDDGGASRPVSEAASLSRPGEFLSGPSEGESLDIVLNYINENSAALGLSEADVTNLVVSDMYQSQHNDVTHIYLQQQHNDISVYNAILNANVTSDGRIINIGNRFVSNLANVAVGTSSALSPEAAVAAAASELDLTLSQPLVVEEVVGGPAQAVVLSSGGISQDAIPVYLVYQPVANGQVRLAWDMTIYELSSEHWWSIRVDAANGSMLSKVDWVVQENVGHEGEKATAHAPVGAAQRSQNLLWSQQAVNNPDDYFVFAYPLEDPDDGPPTVEVDPADPLSNPFAWHDTNGAAGPEFTNTTGNNVLADSDLDANNIPDGNAPDVGPGLSFNFPYNLSLDPSGYLTASIVNLFYWNNIMHDITYRYGFDEMSGNFQENNYGNGGLGSDSVNADAQDGSGVNNANFGTGPDGINPRMQMFRTTYPFGQAVTVTAPVTLTGVYTANPSNNGGTAMGLSGDIVLVIDGTAPFDDACETLTNDLTGDIALIVWSAACNSSIFVQNAADAGAIAAIIIDNTPLPLTNFGGSPAIPSVAIGSDDGQAFLTALNNNTVTGIVGDHPMPGVDRDTDLDNGVIAHEYGHGVSNRLTGGPATAGCLQNDEQMGEGWSDLQTLFIHADPGDVATDAREVGKWSLGAGLQGIRLFPYSTDTSVNPQTYDSIITNGTSPHSLGEVWALMVWEVYWNLVDVHGFNPDIYDDWTTGGNNLTFQLMMDGMKLQPCSPGFVDGRDAILAADMALTGGANQCAIWQGFAKRGLGFSADQGSSNSRTDGTEAFDLPGACAFLSATPVSQDVCAGNSVDYIVDVGPAYSSPPVTMSSGGEPAGTTSSFNPNPVNSVPMSTTMTVATTGATPAGSYQLAITGTDAITSASFGVELVVFSGNPGAPTLTAPTDGAADQIFQPNFSWAAVADATGYTIEIATDAAFTNIIESASVSGTSYDMVGVLDAGTTYYWRVSAENLCGSTDSAAFSFTTVADSCDPGLFTRTTYYEDFEAGDGGWTHSATVSDTWMLSNASPSPDSGGFAFHVEDYGEPNDQALVSPEIVLPTGDTNLMLEFFNEQNFEDPIGSGGCWDGGHLEITTNGGGTWTPLDAELMSDPYNGLGDNGPPAGVNLWCGQVAGNQPWLNSLVDLDAYAGETVQFRYRMLSDAAVGAEGWYIDDVRVQSCSTTPTDVSLSGFGGDEPQTNWLALVAALFVIVAGSGVVLVRRKVTHG
jgi:hypothetical protein